MIKVTLDTNVLIRGVDGTSEEKETLCKLIRLRQEGKIDIALTGRFYQDKKNDSDSERVTRHYQTMQKFQVLPAPIRLNVSLLGQDVLSNEDLIEKLDSIFRMDDRRVTNTTWDVDHIHGHTLAGRDYFLTYDTRILNKAKILEKININVMNPIGFF